MRNIILSFAILLMLPACVVINQGDIGVKRTFGKLSPSVLDAGLHGVNPFTTSVITTPIRTVNLEVGLSLPSKEGLTIQSEISILYSIQKSMVPKIIEEIGPRYVQNAILPVFRSAAADISANFMAKDMHSGQRSVIEEKIRDRMTEVLGPRGFIIEQVLLKSIVLPIELSRAIERKLESEQESMQMDFVLEIERKQAQRRTIEAEGNRDAQQILAEGLSDEIIQLRTIEAFRELSKSPNAKIIITDGKTPMLIPGN